MSKRRGAPVLVRLIRRLKEGLASGGAPVVLIPAIAYLSLLWPAVYRGVVGETDVSEMVAAIVLGHSSGLGSAAGMHYNYSVSFLFYEAVYGLVPAPILRDPGRLMTLLNYCGFLFAAGALAFLGLSLRRLFGCRVAFVTTSLLGFSPMYLELGMSCHPMLPALFFLCGGFLALTVVNESGTASEWRITGLLLAVVALTTALCLRQDFFFAFPFLALADEALDFRSSKWRKSALLRATVLSLSIVIYFVLRNLSGVATLDSPESLRDFFATFYDVSNVAKGAVVLFLGTGIATIVALCVLCVVQGLRGRLIVSRLVLACALAGPTLLFWIPNPTPVRHMMFAVIALALVVGWSLAALTRGVAALVVGMGLIVGNQALAEAAHGVVVAHYPWSYPEVGGRRSTYSVPVGAFVFDHASNNRTFQALRAEGAFVAQRCVGNLLIVADQPYYLIMALVNRDSSSRVSAQTTMKDRDVWTVRNSRCTATIVQKYKAWPRDVLPELLDDVAYFGWPIYYQELTRGRSDRATVPHDRGLLITAN